MLTIKTLQGTHRMSTQDLLLAIEEAVGNGETSFEIEASGQHDIGGPLWNREGKALRFHVTNPGQRVGSMCLDNTEILVDGPAPADVGWLNAGGRIVVRGDAGDTAGHCAAAGVIHIGGRAGARSGSLMKHDPLYAPPELWVLKNVGSFSFEFMGGGKAVVCGYDCEGLPSVLGERPCVGMVGGIVYVRGAFSEDVADDLAVSGLESDDIAYLDAGLETFLSAVGRPELYAVLSDWSEWRKMYPLTLGGHSPRPDPMPMKAFRAKEWIQGGIFSDVCRDDFVVNTTVARGLYRQRVPSWDNAACAAPCEFRCPASIPTQLRYNLLRAGKVEEAYKLVLDYTPFPGSVCGGVCPNRAWKGDRAASTKPSKRRAGAVPLMCSCPVPPAYRQCRRIGGGVAGLSAAWRLARKGHEVTVYEADDRMGGKLEQVIPRARLPHEILEKELKRIEDMGVRFVIGSRVDADGFQRLRRESDAVIVATGGHIPRVFPWPGHERIVAGIDFLKAINKGENPRVGRNVIVIGCGNAGMDAAAGAYAMGAESVTCIDVQKPAAFAHEIAHIEALGGKLLWPVMTKEITDGGLITADGTLISGDMVIITIGESPDLGYLPEGVRKFRDWVIPG
ncbi:MAG: FAD-dependent oxidoreductase, partial [Bilophila wadsworthia]